MSDIHILIPLQYTGEVRVAIRQDPGDEQSEDILFDQHPTHWIAQNGQRVTSRCGCIREKEVSEEEAHEESSPDDGCVCVVWNRVPEEITLVDGQTKSVYKFIMTVDRDLLVAEQEMRDGTWWYTKTRSLLILCAWDSLQ